MKKMIMLMTLGLGTMLLANPANQMEQRKNVHVKKADKKVQKRNVKKVEKKRRSVVREKRVKKQDRRLKNSHALNRDFRSRNDFERMKHKRRVHSRHGIPRNIIAYKQYRKVWYRSYLYDRLPFYDRHGYFYGYFNEIGYFFEGTFYRYDRRYTYRDRLRGRGLFDPYFYRPFR